MKQYIDLYVGVLKDFKNFSGRTGVRTFWMFTLINFILFMVISFGVGMISGSLASLLVLVLMLVTLVPSIAVLVRRFHDIGKPTIFALIALIPLVPIYFCIQPSQEGDNEFGPKPQS